MHLFLLRPELAGRWDLSIFVSAAFERVLDRARVRDELRARPRQARPGGGIAILAEVTTAVSAYLAGERDRGRIAADADIDSLSLSLVGGGHLLFADREPGPPTGLLLPEGFSRCCPQPGYRSGRDQG